MVALLLLTFVTGAGLSAQGVMNARLRTALDAPVLAALVSFTVGSLVLLLALLVSRERLPGATTAASAPWWAWVGGVLGASFVLMTVLVIPRAGAAATIGLAVTGQLIGSLIIDSFGLLGVSRHAPNPPRLIGALLMLVGVVLIQRF
jgi:transporter family-2 protein